MKASTVTCVHHPYLLSRGATALSVSLEWGIQMSAAESASDYNSGLAAHSLAHTPTSTHSALVLSCGLATYAVPNKIESFSLDKGPFFIGFDLAFCRNRASRVSKPLQIPRRSCGLARYDSSQIRTSSQRRA